MAPPNAADAEIKALKDRLGKLEGVVKTLVESRLESKVTAMEKTLKAVEGTDIVDKVMLAKLMKDNSQKQSDDAAKQAKAIADKAVAEAMKTSDSIKLEQRLKLLEVTVTRLDGMIGALASKR
jgi:hypothetical protein